MKLQAQSMSFRMQIMMLDLSKTALLSTRCVRLHMLTNRILYKCLSSFVCLFHFLVGCRCLCVKRATIILWLFFLGTVIHNVHAMCRQTNYYICINSVRFPRKKIVLSIFISLQYSFVAFSRFDALMSMVKDHLECAVGFPYTIEQLFKK